MKILKIQLSVQNGLQVFYLVQTHNYHLVTGRSMIINLQAEGGCRNYLQYLVNPYLHRDIFSQSLSKNVPIKTNGKCRNLCQRISCRRHTTVVGVIFINLPLMSNIFFIIFITSVTLSKNFCHSFLYRNGTKLF